MCRPDLYEGSTPRQSTPRRQRQSGRYIAVPSRWSGKVVGITDGDTLTVMYGSTPVRVRLYGIDAPESRQAYGAQAKNALSRYVFGKTVTVVKTDMDRYGRVVAKIYSGKADVNASLVRSGYAWWYRQYAPRDNVLSKYQSEAKRKKRGLWRDKNPVAPWEFRRR